MRQRCELCGYNDNKEIQRSNGEILKLSDTKPTPKHGSCIVLLTDCVKEETDTGDHFNVFTPWGSLTLKAMNDTAFLLICSIFFCPFSKICQMFDCFQRVGNV